MAVVQLPRLIIPSGSAVSNALGEIYLRASRVLTIYAPATLPESITIEITPVFDPESGDWKTLVSVDDPIVIAANTAVVITDIAALGLRLRSDGNVGGERVFRIAAWEWMW